MRSNKLQFANFVFWSIIHWEWYLLFSFFKEFHNDEFGCLHGFKVVHNEKKSTSQDEPRNEPMQEDEEMFNVGV